MAKTVRRIKRGSSTISTKPRGEEKVTQIRNVDEQGKVSLASRKKYGRFSSSFINKEGNFQYLVGYSPTHSASIQIVRPILNPSPLPTLPPKDQGEIIELKLYYVDQDGYRQVRTYDAEGKKWNRAYKDWMSAWDKIIEN